jgi:hypothetical protein
MKKIIISVTIFTLLMASSAFAGGIIGHHDLSNNRGLIRVKSIDGNKIAVDIVYKPDNRRLIILTDVYADFNPYTQQAVYSEDRFCPDALRLTFQKNGKVVLREAACANF